MTTSSYSALDIHNSRSPPQKKIRHILKICRILTPYLSNTPRINHRGLSKKLFSFVHTIKISKNMRSCGKNIFFKCSPQKSLNIMGNQQRLLNNLRNHSNLDEVHKFVELQPSSVGRFNLLLGIFLVDHPPPPVPSASAVSRSSSRRHSPNILMYPQHPHSPGHRILESYPLVVGQPPGFLSSCRPSSGVVWPL